MPALRVLGAVAVAAAAHAAAAQAARTRLRTPVARPSLVVFIAVDQMRADYFARFGSQFTGGLARIRAHSAFFPNGMQDHAITETAPGHSTMLSGRNPVHTGILTNALGVGDPAFPLVGGAGGTDGASPRHFRGSELYDWLRAADPEARVLSVSRKDRGAILPVGRATGSVFWFAHGRFTTSTYYADTLPDWVRAYDARDWATPLAGQAWTELRPDTAYREPDVEPWEHDGVDVAFPHRLPAAPADVRKQIENFPWMDSLTLDFALDGMTHERLGERSTPDLLVISLSTTDAVGHAYGPDSREMHDQMLRLDHWLGWFLDSLSVLVPAERQLVVLTADHGATPIPEYARALRHEDAGRIDLAGIARRARTALDARWNTRFTLTFDTGLLLADVDALRARGIDTDSLAAAIAAEVRALPGVAHVYDARTLAAAPATDTAAARWRRQLSTAAQWLLCVSPRRGYIFSGLPRGASHGTTQWDDVNVPIAFMGAGIAPRTVTRPVPTTDIAPTIAAYLGVRPTERLDGTVLREVVPAPRRVRPAAAPAR